MRIGDLIESKRWWWIPFAPVIGFVMSVDVGAETVRISNRSPYVPVPTSHRTVNTVKAANWQPALRLGVRVCPAAVKPGGKI